MRKCDYLKLGTFLNKDIYFCTSNGNYTAIGGKQDCQKNCSGYFNKIKERKEKLNKLNESTRKNN